MIKKRQKRIAVVFGGMFVFSTVCFFSPVDEGTVQSQTASVVTDPTLTVQSASNFAEQLDEMYNQEASMYQQYQTMKNQYSMVKQTYDDVDKALEAMKMCRTFIGMVEKAKSFTMEVQKFKECLNQSEYLNTNEKYEYYVEALDVLENVLENVQQARKTVSDIKGKTVGDQQTAIGIIAGEIKDLMNKFKAIKEEAARVEEIKKQQCASLEAYKKLFSTGMNAQMLTATSEAMAKMREEEKNQQKN